MGSDPRGLTPRLAALAGILGLAGIVWQVAVGPLEGEDAGRRAAAAAASARAALLYRGAETQIGAYGGAPWHHRSDVRFDKPGAHDFTLKSIGWDGEPFHNPIYYGLRVARWFAALPVGGMLDFVHSKALARVGTTAPTTNIKRSRATESETVEVTGTKDGRPLDGRQRIRDLFDRLEFTHGHNMLLATGLLRLPFGTPVVAPYAGLGAGVALPHTEITFKGETRRTYVYQYAGPAAQALLGVEFRVRGVSYFLEYKLTWGGIRAPLMSGETATWAPGDLWWQLQRWWSGRPPEHGWASTNLVSHQAVGGFALRISHGPAGGGR